MLFNTLKQQSSTSCVSAKARGLSSLAALIALKYPKTSLTFAVYLISTTGPNPTGRCNGCTSCHSGRCDSGVQSSELSSSEDDAVMAGVMRICQWHMWRGASYIQLQQAHSESMRWSAVGTMRMCVYILVLFQVFEGCPKAHQNSVHQRCRTSLCYCTAHPKRVAG